MVSWSKAIPLRWDGLHIALAQLSNYPCVHTKAHLRATHCRPIYCNWILSSAAQCIVIERYWDLAPDTTTEYRHCRYTQAAHQTLLNGVLLIMQTPLALQTLLGVALCCSSHTTNTFWCSAWARVYSSISRTDMAKQQEQFLASLCQDSQPMSWEKCSCMAFNPNGC